MTLARTLQTHAFETPDEAREYDALDRTAENRQFVEDLLALGPWGSDVVDLGTGTARIPIEICRSCDSCRVMAADASVPMLELARLNIEIAGQIQRIQLDQADMRQLAYADAYFDVVVSNGTLHCLAEPLVALREAVRVTRPGGLLFFRDLLRPASDEARRQIVDASAPEADECQRALFTASLHAALTLAEVRALVGQLGFDAASVQATGDRHWTWAARKAE